MVSLLGRWLRDVALQEDLDTWSMKGAVLVPAVRESAALEGAIETLAVLRRALPGAVPVFIENQRDEPFATLKPNGETLKDIEHRSGKTSVMVRGFNVNQNQVNGSGDNLVEQARPLLQVEDIRLATGSDTGLLDARDQGFFTVAMPEFWQRPEMGGLLRDVTKKPDKYERL